MMYSSKGAPSNLFSRDIHDNIPSSSLDHHHHSLSPYFTTTSNLKGVKKGPGQVHGGLEHVDAMGLHMRMRIPHWLEASR